MWFKVIIVRNRHQTLLGVNIETIHEFINIPKGEEILHRIKTDIIVPHVNHIIKTQYYKSEKVHTFKQWAFIQNYPLSGFETTDDEICLAVLSSIAQNSYDSIYKIKEITQTSSCEGCRTGSLAKDSHKCF